MTILVALTLLLIPAVVVGQSESFTCEAGWSLFGKYCYKKIQPTAAVALTVAQNQCKAQGSELASIHSIEENDFVVGLTKPFSGKKWWIGMRLEWSHATYSPSQAGTGKLTFSWWTDGSPVDFGNVNAWFTPPEPNNEGSTTINKGNCVDMHWDYRFFLNDLPCTFTTGMGAMCKRSDMSTCQQGGWSQSGNWTVFRQNCYKAFPAPASGGYNFDTAEAMCVQNGGHLTSIHDDEEMTFLRGLATSIESPAAYSQTSGNRFYTGMKLERSGFNVISATWSDGTPATYGVHAPWGGKYTTASYIEPYGSMGVAATGGVYLFDDWQGKWNDDGPQNTAHGMICKKPATGVSVIQSSSQAPEQF